MQSLKTLSTSSSVSRSPETGQMQDSSLVLALSVSNFLLLTQSQQVVLQLNHQHHAVLVLVVQLQALQEVLVASLVLLLLDLAEDGQELLDGQLLLALLLGGSHLLAEGQRRVEVQGAQNIANLASVDLTLTLHIEDGEGELSPCKK